MAKHENIAPDGGQVQFSIESSFENVADLAERISVICAECPGSTNDMSDMLRLCLAEALNNVVEHAYSGAEGKPIYAQVQITPQACNVTLIDEGAAMPGGQLPDGTNSFEPDDLANLPEGGFGWMLIRSEMDDVTYERREGCNVLTMSKNFPS